MQSIYEQIEKYILDVLFALTIFFPVMVAATNLTTWTIDYLEFLEYPGYEFYRPSMYTNILAKMILENEVLI